jgi:hypothetical protein
MIKFLKIYLNRYNAAKAKFLSSILIHDLKVVAICTIIELSNISIQEGIPALYVNIFKSH